jgi:hypothetical protein
MTQPLKPWLTRQEAAEYLTGLGCPIAAGTLANWAHCSRAYRGARYEAYCFRGPRYVVFGWRTVRYRRDDLDEWAESRLAEAARPSEERAAERAVQRTLRRLAEQHPRQFLAAIKRAR